MMMPILIMPDSPLLGFGAGAPNLSLLGFWWGRDKPLPVAAVCPSDVWAVSEAADRPQGELVATSSAAA
ncbi:hypothetical protein ACWDBO_39060 [Streptomyces mirabilis]|uniref:hypothetical protein n=1 Tax=Streptomyces TaxID=1883 RepID=UPI0029AE8CE7|nr:hypothetical protein [Streptomyces sp. AK02-04a]MDX3762904.1 hypothetical protein [Streptomyces sp. AK02-04a]